MAEEASKIINSKPKFNSPLFRYATVIIAMLLASGILYGIYYGVWISSFLVAVAYMECFIGLLIVYASHKASNGIEAGKRLVVGLAVFMLGFLSLQLMMQQYMENLNIF